MPFEIIRNDITTMKVAIIVNPTDCKLSGAGGLDAAIHKAAGPELDAECRLLDGCVPGQAKITKAYNLPAKYIIHTVGPVWEGGNSHEKELLTSCYRSSLELAVKKRCKSIAFPVISAGTFGYPKDEAVEVAEKTIQEFLKDHEMMVYLVVFGKEEYFKGKELYKDIAAFIDDNYVDAALAENRRNDPLEIRSGRYGLARRRILSDRNRDDQKEHRSLLGTSSGKDLDDVDWDEVIKQKDEGFAISLLKWIDAKGMKDVDCYKDANVDKKLFSRIHSEKGYKVSKPTACAFAVALKLTLPEALELIGKAGFSLTHSSEFDLVIEFCLINHIYNVARINEVLYERGLQLLGSSRQSGLGQSA